METIGRETLFQLMDDLSDYSGMRRELESVYAVYHSPVFSRIVSKKTVRNSSDPTLEAFHKAEELNNLIERKEKALIETMSRVETWLQTVKDPEAAAAIRWHFLLGKTWEETALMMYGENGPGRDYVRKRVYSFLKENEIPAAGSVIRSA